MNSKTRIIAITALATVALSASAQSTRKPSGNITRTNRAATTSVAPSPTPTETTRPATALPVVTTVKPQSTETTVSAEPVAPTIAPISKSELPAPEVKVDSAPVLATRPADSKIILPVGTAIRIKLDASISTHDSLPGDAFSGRISQDVVVEGKTVIPTGAKLNGRVSRLFEPRRIAGRPAIQLVPDSVTLSGGKILPIDAVVVDTSDPKTLHVNEEGRIKGPGISKQDKVEFVAASAAGTVAGSVINLGKGTWIGAAAGATFATGRWLVRRHSLELPAGTELIMEITNPVATTTSTLPKMADGGN